VCSSDLKATQDLLEWGRRSTQIALVARFEEEARQLAARGRLSRDEEMRTLVDLRNPEPPHA
jgi:hypothetical protein